MHLIIPTVLISMAVFALFVVALGVGVLVKQRPIKGSCGGCANCVSNRRSK